MQLYNLVHVGHFYESLATRVVARLVPLRCFLLRRG